MERIQLIDDITGKMTRGLPLSTLATQDDLAAISAGVVPDESITNTKISPTANIDESKLNLDHSTSDLASRVPAGAIFQYAGATTPTGFLICDGSALSRTTYAELFVALGSGAIYGDGDGSTTFNIPDLRGKFIRGLGGSSGGLGVTQAEDFKSHNHTQNSHNHTQASHNHTQNAHTHTQASHKHYGGPIGTNTSNGLGFAGVYGYITGTVSSRPVASSTSGSYTTAVYYGTNSVDPTINSITPTNNATTATNNATTATNNSTGGTETRPTNMAMNYIIKY